MVAQSFARLAARHVVTRLAPAALLALALIGQGGPAMAQTKAAAPSAAPSQIHQPSPAEILLAKQIIDLKQVKDVFQPLIRGVIIKARNNFMQTNFMWAKDLNEVADNLQKQYAPRVNELIDTSARIYASHFTEQELKDLLAFYQSPLGLKMIKEEPKALDESMISAGKWAETLSLEVIDSMRAEMKKRGHDI